MGLDLESRIKMEEKFGTSPLCFPCMQMLAGREVRPEKGENINKKAKQRPVWIQTKVAF